MIEPVLVANRGEIACRIIRTLDRTGHRVGRACSPTPTAARRTCDLADDAVRLGPGAGAGRYLRRRRRSSRRRAHRRRRVHPGYGFLVRERRLRRGASRRPGSRSSARRPSRSAAFGAKHTARAAGRAAGVPLLAGHRRCSSTSTTRSRPPRRVGFPVMLKSDGRRRRHRHAGVHRRGRAPGGRRARACARARPAFGSGGGVPRALVRSARHVEVQVFGDGAGTVVALGDRDCSLQRRHQKVIEEAPAPGLARRSPRAARRRRRSLCSSPSRYRSAGTVEFVYDADAGEVDFLEVNTRLQVEHPVTEAVTGRRPGRVDGAPGGRRHRVRRRRCGARTGRAGTPSRRASTPRTRRATTGPSAGLVTDGDVARRRARRHLGRRRHRGHRRLRPAARQGHRARRRPRRGARRAARRALARPASPASRPTSACCARVVADARVPRRARHHRDRSADASTTPAARSRCSRRHADHRAGPGPAGVGSGHVGVPPCGPMDDLVVPARQPRARQPPRARRAWSAPPPARRCGSRRRRRLPDRRDMPRDRSTARRCRCGRAGRGRRPARRSTSAPRRGPGLRTYVLVARRASTCRATWAARRRSRSAASAATAAARCAPGDVLHLGASGTLGRSADAGAARAPPDADDHDWEIGVARGPARRAGVLHRTTTSTRFYATDWEVHFNSARTGVRLVGPRPQWARPDGGEAGLHPSNIHDTPYAVGAVDFTGDMPIILGPDGPSLGGFVCPATVVAGRAVEARASCAPATRVRFVAVDAEARARRQRRRAAAPATRRRGTAAATGCTATGRAHRCRAARRRTPRPDGHLPPQRRRQPARRVRADGARPRPAPAGARARRVGCAASAVARRRRRHARHPLAAGAGRPGDARASTRRARRSSLGAEAELPATRRARGPVAHRAPAAVLGRPRDARGDRALHARRARRRALVPVEHRVHPPHQRPRRRSTTCADIVFDAELPRARPRRRVPRRAGRHAARPAPPAGHHEVQPGAHVDARRTPSASAAPTCASTGWRARAATSSSAAPCRCGTATRASRALRAGEPVAAAVLRPHPLVSRSRPTSCSTCGPTPPAGRLDLRIDDGTFSLADHQRFLAEHAASIAAFRHRPAAPSPRSGRAGPRRASSPRRASRSNPSLPPDDRDSGRSPMACSSWRRRSTAAWRLHHECAIGQRPDVVIAGSSEGFDRSPPPRELARLGPRALFGECRFACPKGVDRRGGSVRNAWCSAREGAVVDAHVEASADASREGRQQLVRRGTRMRSSTGEPSSAAVVLAPVRAPHRTVRPTNW